MAKRTIGISLILLANIVLLVHAFVLHHHHENRVCFETNHCTDDHTKHDHQPSEHNHKHDGNSDNCILKQAIAIPAQLYKQIYHYYDNYSERGNFQFVLLTSNTNNSVNVPIFTFTYPSFHKYQSLYFVNHCIGLRAPPTV